MLNVKEYVGIPFKKHGRDRDGLDCWGLFRMIYSEQLGITLPSYENEYNDPLNRVAVSNVVSRKVHQWDRIKDEAIGDGILLRIVGHPMHVGIVISEKYMIHCLPNIGVCIEDYKSRIWRKRIIGFYRYQK
jgi:cell wall-associated NlpC family hydrolase